MDPDKFFNYPSGNVRVFNFILSEEDIGKRMWRLLNVVVERLPEEEQFRFLGAFMFSSIDNLAKIWEEFDKRVPPAWKGKISSSKFAPDMRQVGKKDRYSIIDGYCTYDFDLSTLERKKLETKCDVCDLELPTPERLERHRIKAHGNVLDGEQWLAFYVVSILTDNLSDKSDDYIVGLIAYEISVMSCAWQGTKKRLKQIDKKDIKNEARRLGFGNEIDALD